MKEETKAKEAESEELKNEIDALTPYETSIKSVPVSITFTLVYTIAALTLFTVAFVRPS